MPPIIPFLNPPKENLPISSPSIAIDDIFPLVDALLKLASPQRSWWKRSMETFPFPFPFPFTLPLDFTDAIGAFAADVFGEFNEAEDIFL
jgi:hypothetical protein